MYMHTQSPLFYYIRITIYPYLYTFPVYVQFNCTPHQCTPPAPVSKLCTTPVFPYFMSRRSVYKCRSVHLTMHCIFLDIYTLIWGYLFTCIDMNHVVVNILFIKFISGIGSCKRELGEQDQKLHQNYHDVCLCC